MALSLLQYILLHCMVELFGIPLMNLLMVYNNVIPCHAMLENQILVMVILFIYFDTLKYRIIGGEGRGGGGQGGG